MELNFFTAKQRQPHKCFLGSYLGIPRCLPEISNTRHVGPNRTRISFHRSNCISGCRLASPTLGGSPSPLPDTSYAGPPCGWSIPRTESVPLRGVGWTRPGGGWPACWSAWFLWSSWRWGWGSGRCKWTGSGWPRPPAPPWLPPVPPATAKTAPVGARASDDADSLLTRFFSTLIRRNCLSHTGQGTLEPYWADVLRITDTAFCFTLIKFEVDTNHLVRSVIESWGEDSIRFKSASWTVKVLGKRILKFKVIIGRYPINIQTSGIHCQSTIIENIATQFTNLFYL